MKTQIYAAPAVKGLNTSVPNNSDLISKYNGF